MRNKFADYFIVVIISISIILIYLLRSYNLIFDPIYGIIYHKETNSLWKLKLLPNTALINKWEPFYSLNLNQKYYTIVESIDFIGNFENPDSIYDSASNMTNSRTFSDSLIHYIYQGQILETIHDSIDRDFFSSAWNYYYNQIDKNKDVSLVNLLLNPIKVSYFLGKIQTEKKPQLYLEVKYGVN